MAGIFRFKKFEIKQGEEVFKVGTDGVLLGCLADIADSNTILDIGTGTGLVALICAQRNEKLKIIAIDSEESAVFLAGENAEKSVFSSRIRVIHSELQQFNPEKKFDYIICNPPYFEVTEQLHTAHPIARQQLKLDYSTLLESSLRLLEEGGTIGYIFPYEQESFILKCAESIGLFPKRVVRIAGIKGGKVKRTFLELSLLVQETVQGELVVEESPRVRSVEYAELTKDFYL